MSRMLAGAFSLLVAAGCSTPDMRRPAQMPPLPPAPPAMAAAPASAPRPPLPPGWVWPAFDVRAGIAAASAILRPMDVSRLIPAAGKGPCAPIQVAPNVWISLPCGDIPRLTASRAVPRRQSLLPTAGLPAQFDLRDRGLDGPVKNQQMVGVCWSFALADLMDNALRREGRSDVVAPMHVVASHTWDDMWSHGKSSDELVTEEQWPYDPVAACKLNEAKSERWCEEAYHVKPGSWRSDPALVAQVDHADASGYFHVASVEALDTPVDTDQLAALIAGGHAVYADLDIDTDSWGFNATRDGVIDDYSAGGMGHGIALVGYRGAGTSRQFLVHNSWGTSWANGGYAWISDAMIRAHALELFTLEVGKTNERPLPGAVTPAPGPTPAPAPAPQSTTCTTRDVVFGVCAAACPGGNAPVAGFCVPAQSGAPACASGQGRDWVTAQCAALCRNGLAPAAGVCAW